AKDLSRFSGGEFRILEGVASGDEIPPVEVTVDPQRQEGLLERDLVAEPLDWYRGDSPWGAPILVPQLMVHYLYQPGSVFLTQGFRDRGGAVGLFGAIELANLAGPMLVGRSYEMSGTVLAVGQSPKTE